MSVRDRPKTVSLTLLVASVAAALAVGSGLGWWVHAELTAPTPGGVGSPYASAVGELEQVVGKKGGGGAEEGRELQGALFDSWMTSLRLAAKAKSLESLLDELQAGDVEPEDLVRGVVAEMSESELEMTIAMTTDFTSDDLAEVEDVRRFATRLADIAMDGLIVDASDETGVASVVLSDSASESEAREIFLQDQSKIYVIFKTQDYDLSTVMLKWFHVDGPQLLLFRRFKILPGKGSGWVWLDGEKNWKPGNYQVDVYSGDDQMVRLAVGRYVVQPLAEGS